MLCQLKKPYAFIYRYDDYSWNENFAEFFPIYNEEELKDIISQYEEEQPYTGLTWYVYLLK